MAFEMGPDMCRLNPQFSTTEKRKKEKLEKRKKNNT